MNPFAPLMTQLLRVQEDKERSLVDRIAELAPGLTQREMAQQLGVSRSTIFNALRAKRNIGRGAP